MTDDLVARLKAGLDQDEAAAMAATGTAWAWEATGDKDNSWAVGYVEDEDGRPLSGEIEHGQGIVIDGVCESINGNLADAPHIARQNPARTLREVAAHRKILARYTEPLEGLGLGEQLQLSQEKQGLYFAVCALAAIYGDDDA